MPLLAGVAAIMIVSYTVFRLQYAANNLPYDPGQALPAVEVAPAPSETLPERLRSTFVQRHSARITTTSGEADVREAWPLYGLERERAIRLLDEQIQAAHKLPPADRNRETCEHLATVVAARELIGSENAFVVEQELMALPQGGDWLYWTSPLFETKGRRRILYVAIDLTQFAFVRDAATADPRTFNPR